MRKWYSHNIESGSLIADPEQETVVDRLQLLSDELTASDPKQHSFLDNFLKIGASGNNPKYKESHSLLTRFLSSDKQQVRGVFIHGSVGRGKTYLIDGFFLNLARTDKLRVHFHGFMRHFHLDMKRLEGQKDALTTIANELADQFSLICFDEFHVSDITDAMILGRILEVLLERGVVIVATSNYAPDALYPNGLARERFLPTIALINEQLDVINLDGDLDYRLRTLKSADLYYSPINSETQKSFEEMFTKLAQGIHLKDSVKVGSRRMKAIKRTSDAVWFDYEEVCEGNYAQADYLQIAERFSIVFISNVPELGKKDTFESSRRFTWLIDILYDAKVKLVLQTEKTLIDLYIGEGGESGRTLSRLQEMQSVAYLNDDVRKPDPKLLAS